MSDIEPVITHLFNSLLNTPPIDSHLFNVVNEVCGLFMQRDGFPYAEQN